MILPHRSPPCSPFLSSLSKRRTSLLHSRHWTALQVSPTQMGGSVLSPPKIGDSETLEKKKAAILRFGSANLQVPYFFSWEDIHVYLSILGIYLCIMSTDLFPYLWYLSIMGTYPSIKVFFYGIYLCVTIYLFIYEYLSIFLSMGIYHSNNMRVSTYGCPYIYLSFCLCMYIYLASYISIYLWVCVHLSMDI